MPKKVIGILVATTYEEEALNHLFQGLSEIKQEKIAGILFYKVTSNSKEIILGKTGVGKVQSAMVSTILIHHFKVQTILFSGVAGSFQMGKFPLESLCLVKNFCDGDFDIRVFGYQKGEGELQPKYIESTKDLRTLALKLAQKENLSLKEVTVCTTDRFIHKNEDRLEILQHFDADLAEMEGYAMAKVCTQHNIPFLMLRSISDDAGETKNTHELYETLAKRISIKHAYFLGKILLDL